MTQEEKGQIKDMQSKLDRVEDKVDDVLTVLKGDEFNHSQGLVSEVKNIKSRVKSLETIKKKFIWLATGAGLAGGLALDKLVEFIKSVLKIITVILAILLFVGCGSARKKQVKAHLYFKDNPKELAELCESTFPLEKIYIKGHNIVLKDTVVKNDTIPVIVEKDCPDGTKVLAECPPCKEITTTTTITRVDTLEVESGNYKFLLQESDTSLKNAKANIKSMYYIIGSLIGFVVLILFLSYRNRKEQ